MEKWKYITAYPDYQVSSLGRIKSVKFKKERFIATPLCNNRYAMASVYRNGKRGVYSVHRLVAHAFEDLDLESNLVVHHKNNIKSDNRLSNLEIVTSSDNNRTHYKCSSDVKGVGFCKRTGKWLARNKKRKFLGYFNTEADAISVVNKLGWG